MQNIDLTFATDPQEIRNILGDSKEHGTVVGISSPTLGTGVFLTAVENLIEEGLDVIIVLKGYDVNGYFLQRNKLKLSEIKSVCAFKTVFENPYLKELTGIRFHNIH